MSVLREGDEDMHYSDNSHRWIAPPGTEQSLWEVGVRAHLSRHQATMGGPVAPDLLWAYRPARKPATVDTAASGSGGTLTHLPAVHVTHEDRHPLPGAA